MVTSLVCHRKWLTENTGLQVLSSQIAFQDDGLDCMTQMKIVNPLPKQLPEALIVSVGLKKPQTPKRECFSKQLVL